MSGSRPQVRDDLALRAGYHSPQLDVEVRLNTNESPSPPPPEFAARLEEAIKRVEWNRYPDRTASALRSALAERYRRTPGEMFVANGSNEVLQTLLLTFGGANRTAVVFEPTYALHAHIARITGTRLVEGSRSEDLALDAEEVRRVLLKHEPDLVFLCSPNNPTGLVDPPDVISAVLALAERIGCLLVVDEAYGQFAARSAVDLVGEDVPLVVTRTFSKTWSMAAARLGYMIGPAWLVAELEKVALPYHLDAFKQAAGVAALKFGDEMAARVASIIEERGRVMSAAGELPVTIWPSGANFFLLRADAIGGDDLWQHLVDRSILVRNCSNWPHLEDCLRVTVGTHEENDRLLGALNEILGSAP